MSVRDQIIASSQLKQETVTLPECGNLAVVVREMTVAERNAFLLTFGESVEAPGGYERRPVDDPLREARLVAVTTFDEDGQRVFADDDVEQIGKLPSSVVDRLFEVAARLSGIHSASAADDEGKDKPTQTNGSSAS